MNKNLAALKNDNNLYWNRRLSKRHMMLQRCFWWYFSSVREQNSVRISWLHNIYFHTPTDCCWKLEASIISCPELSNIFYLLISSFNVKWLQYCYKHIWCHSCIHTLNLHIQNNVQILIATDKGKVSMRWELLHDCIGDKILASVFILF